MSENRPLGVTILAILMAIGGILGIIGAIQILTNPWIRIAAALRAVNIGLIYFSLLLSIVALPIAYGFWTGLTWSWYAGLAVSGLSAITNLLQLPGGILGLIIDAVVIYYLLQPNVKEWFKVMGGPTLPEISLQAKPSTSEPSSTPPPGMKFCVTCRRAIPSSNVYCPYCGAKQP